MLKSKYLHTQEKIHKTIYLQLYTYHIQTKTNLKKKKHFAQITTSEFFTITFF